MSVELENNNLKRSLCYIFCAHTAHVGPMAPFLAEISVPYLFGLSSLEKTPDHYVQNLNSSFTRMLSLQQQDSSVRGHCFSELNDGKCNMTYTDSKRLQFKY